jgi:hypothetical protein
MDWSRIYEHLTTIKADAIELLVGGSVIGVDGTNLNCLRSAIHGPGRADN